MRRFNGMSEIIRPRIMKYIRISVETFYNITSLTKIDTVESHIYTMTYSNKFYEIYENKSKLLVLQSQPWSV